MVHAQWSETSVNWMFAAPTEIMDAAHLPLFENVDVVQVGARNMQKALLYAALEPSELLRKYEAEGDFTSRLALMEELKSFPFADVWARYCELENVPSGLLWLDEVRAYEHKILSER